MQEVLNEIQRRLNIQTFWMRIKMKKVCKLIIGYV